MIGRPLPLLSDRLLLIKPHPYGVIGFEALGISNVSDVNVHIRLLLLHLIIKIGRSVPSHSTTVLSDGKDNVTSGVLSISDVEFSTDHFPVPGVALGGWLVSTHPMSTSVRANGTLLLIRAIQAFNAGAISIAPSSWQTELGSDFGFGYLPNQLESDLWKPFGSLLGLFPNRVIADV